MLVACRDTFSNYSFPMKQTYSFDVIGFKEEKPYRVKVISTDSKQPSGSYIANLRKSGGYSNSKEHKAPFDPKECDYVYICTPSEKYLIPSEKIKQRRAITLSQFNEFMLV